jgi:hypothetical protein
MALLTELRRAAPGLWKIRVRSSLRVALLILILILIVILILLLILFRMADSFLCNLRDLWLNGSNLHI